MTKRKRDVTTIYVIRHGESQSNVYALENPDKPASHFGEFGSSLTQKGRDQTQKLAQYLKEKEIAAIFSSDLNRAKETAEILAREHMLSVQIDRVLRERFFGSPMSNIQKQEIEKQLEELNEQEKFAFRYFPNGESGHDVVNRFKQFLLEISKEYRNKTIIIVTHGYTMRSFLIHEAYAKYDELPNGSIKNAGYFIIRNDGTTFEFIEKRGIVRNRKYDNEE